MTALVVAWCDEDRLTAATLSTLAAARRCCQTVDLLLAGAACEQAAQQARRQAAQTGLRRLIIAADPCYRRPVAEALAALTLAHAAGYSHILTAANGCGKGFLPRVAAALDAAQLSDIVDVVAADVFVRPMYAGAVLATVRSSDAVKVISVRPGAFALAAAASSSPQAGAVERVAAVIADVAGVVVSSDINRGGRPDPATAAIIVAGGRGLGSRDNFQRIIEPLADRLGAAIGATRAAVDAGFVGNECQIGQTGLVVAPRLYIAMGVSGAVQHLAGIQNAGVVVAINRDAEAPLFRHADYGVVGDLFAVTPALLAAL